MVKRYLIILLICILFIAFNSTLTEAIGVRPLVYEFEMAPGESRNFEFLLTPESTTKNVEINFFQPIQKLDGGLSYEAVYKEVDENFNWIDLESDLITVPAGSEQVLRGEINIPFDAAGTYNAILMIENVIDEEQRSQELFSFKVRYAVRITVNIDRPGLRARAEVNNIQLNKNNEDNPQISANIKNISSLNFNAEAEATLRDGNNRLIERLNIVSESAEKANRISTRIYPNSEVIFSGELSQPLYPGEYNLQIYLKYGDNRQLVEKKIITLEKELRKSGPRRYISFEPNIISENLRAGAPSTHVIDINNLFNEEVKIKISQKDLFEKGEHSLFNIGELQMRGGEEFVLEPRKSARSVLIFRSPRDASAGGYYGQLELKVFDKNDELLETRNIDLEMMIGEDWKYNAEIDNFKFENQEGIQSISFDLKNLSSAHINPRAMVILKNGSDQIIKTVNLSAPSDVEKLLPDKSTSLVGRTSQIEAGTYNAEIVVTNNNEEIKRINTSVDVN